jgi:Kdo2-lipid IVA lauroyltransferase/acyltransferase
MVFLRLLSRLPFSVLYAFSDFLYVLTYYIIGYRKNLVRINLTNSFPEKSEEELLAIEKAFYQNLCDYGVETIKLLSMSQGSVKTRMRYTNPELVFRYRDQGLSVLLLSSHQFNWEWLLVSGELSLGVPIDFVYQPVNNPFFDNFIQECRTRFGGYAIKRNEVARELIKRKNIIRGIAIVADQYPGHAQDKKYETRFLNQDTVFFFGSQQMAELTQYPALYAVVERVSRGYYTCTLVNVGEPPYIKNSTEVVENYARAVERVIQQHPSGWLWSHNRWKKRHLQET